MRLLLHPPAESDQRHRRREDLRAGRRRGRDAHLVRPGGELLRAVQVTLVTHSLQVLAIALVVGGRFGKLSQSRAALGLLLGAIIDLVGYGLGRAFIYGTPAVAIMKIPFDVIAAIIGLGLAYYIYFHTGFVKQFKKVWDEK